jgi:predicted secreted protein
MIWLTGITGTVLALVSIACSAILWSSYAVSTLDTVIASFTAAALVLCQYLFFINARHHTRAMKHAHTAAVAVLYITSCAATVGWLESRYQANSRTELQADSSYTTQQATQQQRLADLAASIQQLRTLAATDTENGYRARAARLLRQAQQQDDTRAQILRELNSLNHQTSTSSSNAGTALANGLNSWRWLLWALLALLVDLCPMLCFAHVAHTFTPVQRTTDTTETTTATPETTQPKPAPALPATAETHPATEHIQARIINGEAPAMRSFIGNEFNGKKLRHADLTQIFTTLEQRGIIRRQGNRFEPTEQTKQEAA